MLLNNYRHVTEIDNAIADLHSRLNDLYKERQALFSEAPKAKTRTKGDAHLREHYDQLSRLWATQGVKIPAFSNLKAKLSTADRRLSRLTMLRPECNFVLVLLPPSKEFNALKTDNNITVTDAVAKPRASHSWKLFIVASNDDGAAISDYAQFIIDGGIKIDDQLMPGLSVYEYAQFVSHHPTPIDQDSWSVLVKDTDHATKTVPCVTNLSGSYSFDSDSSEVLIGDNHFRPAVEIK